MGYLAELGIDALWLSPCFASPQVDHGYDISDYRDIDDLFGSLADMDELIATAHDYGIKVTLDFVPNHTSDQHAWFQAAVAAGRGSPERDRYLFRDGRGPGGDEPPEQLEVGLRRPVLDPGRGARRLTGAVVLPPVRRRAARPQLAQPRGGRGVRQRPALLDGPGRRRVPDRRLRRADEGRHLPRHGLRRADHPQGRRQPGARRVPGVPPRHGRATRATAWP